MTVDAVEVSWLGAGSLRRLAGDRRGAVMILAVFMSAFVVGMLWYVIGIGDAAIHRSQMQDAVDAAAFTAAVYHARGMNLLAMTNLIIGAIFATLVAFKVAVLLMQYTKTVYCVLAQPYAPPDPDIADYQKLCDEIRVSPNREGILLKHVGEIEARADKALKAFSKGQRGVAKGVPILAEAKAMAMLPPSGPVTELGIVTVSLRPDSSRLGLPVAEGGLRRLCKPLASQIGHFGLVPLKMAGVPVKVPSKIMPGVSEHYPDAFCFGDASHAKQLEKAVDPADLIHICKIRHKAFDDHYASVPSPPAWDQTACMQHARSVRNGMGLHHYAIPTTPFDFHGRTPKAAVLGAHNGSDFFQIWAGARGTGFVGDTEKGRQGTRAMPSWQFGSFGPDATDALYERDLTTAAFSQAEYYFAECKERVHGGCEEEGLWHMTWKARPRRMFAPGLAPNPVDVAEIVATWAGPNDASNAASVVLSDGSPLVQMFAKRVEGASHVRAGDLEPPSRDDFQGFAIH